jgi:hypothetical protein
MMAIDSGIEIKGCRILIEDRGNGREVLDLLEKRLEEVSDKEED